MEECIYVRSKLKITVLNISNLLNSFIQLIKERKKVASDSGSGSGVR